MVAGVTGGAVAGFGILTAIGFTSAGVAAGSSAALWQAGIGNVAAGTIFSGLQAVGATGAIWSVGAAVGGALSAVIAAMSL
ncbi:hypothetical protein EV426DRAFT_712579 [Tirmania nivea]|nr:hypothetical protein EV426DRAFT_712579 [Tirmania nivea]